MRRGGAALFFVVCAAAGVFSALLLAATPSAIAQVGTTTTGSTTTGSTTTGVTTTAPPPTTPPPTTTTPPPTTAPPPPTTAPPPPTTAPPPPPRPTTIPAGVKIANQVLVGGLSPAEATIRVRAYFARPLTIRAGRSTLRVTPQQLGAASYVGDAVKAARVAKPGRNVPLKVRVSQPQVERYVQRLATRFDRPTADSRLFLRNGRPFVTKESVGRRTQQQPAVAAILRNLTTHTRPPVRVGFETIRPHVTRASIGKVIVIRREAKKLDLYNGMRLVRTFGVATGQPQYPTPLGRFHVVVKWRNPWWYPPASDWAKDAKPIPPGPGNPLGTRWMGISSPAVGIHGTPDAASIGYSASHGCIRMLIPQVEWLFERVGIGTPVYIIR